MMIYKFQRETILVGKCFSAREVQKAVEEVFRFHEKSLPKRKGALILLKPNLNNDLNSLMGNSTDLRLIVAVLKSLKGRGYSNIVIADGPNCGINYIGIDVFRRLRIDKIAELFGVKYLNLNKEKPYKVRLTTSDAHIARVCKDADFFINLPKVKTHMEAGMTCACKNLMGCFLGMEKRQMHWSLAPNIVRINEILKPDLNIVDGLVVMEGNGPGNGIPKRVGLVLAGKTPFLIDALVARVFGLDFRKIGYLKIAIEKGYIVRGDIEKLDKIEKICELLKPDNNIFAKIMLNNIFVLPRYWKLISPFFSLGIVTKILYRMGVKQDLYNLQKDKITGIKLDKKKCTHCKKCLEFCPTGLPIDSKGFDFKGKECVQCLYCYLVCPENAIQVDGDLNYLEEQKKRFLEYIRKL